MYWPEVDERKRYEIEHIKAKLEASPIKRGSSAKKNKRNASSALDHYS